MPPHKRINLDVIETIPTIESIRGKGKGANREELEKLVILAAQICPTTDDAAVILGVPKKLLPDSYKTAWELGQSIQRSQILRAQYLSALSGVAVSQIWAGKQQLGQQDKPENAYVSKRLETTKSTEDVTKLMKKMFSLKHTQKSPKKLDPEPEAPPEQAS